MDSMEHDGRVEDIKALRVAHGSGAEQLDFQHHITRIIERRK